MYNIEKKSCVLYQRIVSYIIYYKVLTPARRHFSQTNVNIVYLRSTCNCIHRFIWRTKLAYIFMYSIWTDIIKVEFSIGVESCVYLERSSSRIDISTVSESKITSVYHRQSVCLMAISFGCCVWCSTIKTWWLYASGAIRPCCYESSVVVIVYPKLYAIWTRSWLWHRWIIITIAWWLNRKWKICIWINHFSEK